MHLLLISLLAGSGYKTRPGRIQRHATLEAHTTTRYGTTTHFKILSHRLPWWPQPPTPQSSSYARRSSRSRFLSFLNPQPGADTATTSAHAPLLDTTPGLLLPLSAAGTLFASVAAMYRHLRHAAAAAGSRRCHTLKFLDFGM
ncbi:hypothetical protein PVAP13_3NG254720 [Panicum virgatum]|uniref:Uncharacterized protein n=1 Tax=Panicum virgatum TaxID=38727 RepID=A0A8T0UGS5_PANVG|nr:hypothetical protein PVAP13_3NG254720 [Panicum virgatum]